MFLKAAVEIQTDAQRKLLADLIEQHADLSSIIMEDVREIGCEWLCKQALEELSVCEFLKQCNWDETQAERALMHIISRATYPASEHKTAQWIHDNSAVAELFDKDPLSINRFSLVPCQQHVIQTKGQH